MPVLESHNVSTRVVPQELFFREAWSGGLGDYHVTGAGYRAEVRPEIEPVISPRSNGMIRGFDIVVSFVAILALLPLMLLVYFMVRLTSTGPGVFSQMRVGREGELFPCFKFRTMVVDAKEQLERILAGSEEARQEWDRDQKLRNDPRVTPIGAFLRKSSLDELPQLFNVLAGQMSIVGPRPIVQAEIVRYGTRFPAYCSVRPGLTGLWQMSGRNDVSYAKRVRLDTLYVRRQSLMLNVSICLRTVPALLNSRGCY